MRKICLLFLCFSLSAVLQAQHSVTVIPKPVSVEVLNKTFTIGKNVRVKTNMNKKEEMFLNSYLQEELKSMRQVRDDGKLKYVVAKVYKGKSAPDYLNHDDAYRLRNVDGKQILIEGKSERAVFYGLQTLLQLIDDNGNIVSVNIDDYPRFPYRGLMIDCSRHFWDKEFILKQIDAMARYKFSYLHLHLTDAAGWRIESKKYPRLTEMSAYRTESDWNKWWVSGKDRKYVNMQFLSSEDSSKKYNNPDSHPYGGFYTQDDLREIVAYAAERHITVIPEIEMPGHSEEVFAAYPELSCTGKPYTSGEFCVGNEDTFTFLENILEEVMDIFPSEYIHIGGDEASRKSWENCPKCQKRMADEGLSSTAELQSYMTARIERFLNSHGRKLMGWDEILEGFLAPNATVMSWRGTDGGLKAAAMNHHVVMSPGGYCYLDAYQDAPSTQPRAFGGYTPLERTYSFEPVPQELRNTEQEKYIDGIQGNLWTEMVETPSHLEYMLWARGLAISEIGWSQTHDDFSDFRNRAILATKDLKKRGYNVFQVGQEVGCREESKSVISHEAIGKPVTYLLPYADVYSASGEGSLTDGLSGNWSYGDGRWQGFISGERFDAFVDMLSPTDVRNITVNFMQFSGPEIFAPSEVEFSISDDGINFTPIYNVTHDVNSSPDYFIMPVSWSGYKTARYIRVKAKSGKYGGWIFTDEIFINKK